MRRHAPEALIRLSLASFGYRFLNTPWHGKEREPVSHDAFSILAKSAFGSAPSHG